MDVLEAIMARRSVRRFKSDEVPDEFIKKIIEAAIWAPSAGNLQSWDLIVVKDKKRKVELAKAAWNQFFIAQAPVVFVVCCVPDRSAWRYGDRGEELYTIQDAAAATQNILLAAHALNLSTCWIGAFSENAAKEVLNIPRNVRPVAIIPIGFPDERPRAPSRRKISDVVHEEVY